MGIANAFGSAAPELFFFCIHCKRKESIKCEISSFENYGNNP